MEREGGQECSGWRGSREEGVEEREETAAPLQPDFRATEANRNGAEEASWSMVDGVLVRLVRSGTQERVVAFIIFEKRERILLDT